MPANDPDGPRWTEDATTGNRGSDPAADWDRGDEPNATGETSPVEATETGGFVFGDEADDRGGSSGAPQSDRVKSALAAVAGADDEAVVERAAAAIEDLDAAVEFLERDGLSELERSVESTDDPDVRARGERALAAFRRFGAAAAGEDPDEHFRRGHDTDIRGGTEAPRE